MPAGKTCWCCGAKTKLDLVYQGQAGTKYLCKDEAACLKRMAKLPRRRSLEPEPAPSSGKRDQSRRFE